MNARESGLSRLPNNGGPRELPGDHDAIDLLEQIEDSLVDLRRMLKSSAHERQMNSAAHGQVPLCLDSQTPDSQHPLRIVLVTEDESMLHRHIALPLAETKLGGSFDDSHAALKQRDDYIAYLCGKIREMTIRIEAWLRLLQERSLTGETAVIVKDAQECVSQLVKTMEIELAIERAELGRERAQLEAERCKFELEKEQAAHGTSATADSGAETPMMKRWRRFLTAPSSPRVSPVRSGTSGIGP